jgi:hypothetical protein
VTRQRTVVIVTMPRSGSSLLAGVLHRLGVSMGPDDDLGLGRHLNRHGCHEDQAFQRISLNMLLETGLLLDLSRRLAIDEARVGRVVARHRRRIEAFVAGRSAPLWGFKDPGLVYTLPHLHHHLPEPLYVHLRRHTGDTARSLYRTFRPGYWLPEMREKLPLFSPANRARLLLQAGALLLTRQGRYHDLAFFEEVIRSGHVRSGAFLAGRRSLRVDLAELAAAPEGVIDGLVGFIGLRPSAQARSAALSFVQPSLLHSLAELTARQQLGEAGLAAS